MFDGARRIEHRLDAGWRCRYSRHCARRKQHRGRHERQPDKQEQELGHVILRNFAGAEATRCRIAPVSGQPLSATEKTPAWPSGAHVDPRRVARVFARYDR
jgi:hypothetical protein